jgi:di/tricarboxylate transporter
MSSDAAIVFAILGVAGACFASRRVRLDITALLVVLALMLTRVLTPREALAGFGDPVVLLVGRHLLSGGVTPPKSDKRTLEDFRTGFGVNEMHHRLRVHGSSPLIGRSLAETEISTHPLAMTVAIAASAAFVTPFSTPVVTLVVAPGSYRFVDFAKVGIPLLVLTWATTMLVTPLVFPF